MYSGTSIPERVFDKVRECRFFLARMADYESAEDIENFLFCLSAFLSAFRSIAYKLYGVTEKQRGKTAKITLKKELHTHPQVGFLIGRSNVEVHADGVKVWQRYNLSIGDSISGAWTHDAELFEDQSEMCRPPRFQPRFQRSAKTQVATVVDWQFEGHQSNLIGLCHDALNEMENFIRQNISVAP
ncbi:MAG: hypothetical protein DMG45_02765 [Acidobacteria bacterium]|nr:MAG: hypothetical protein DMG45_02765 [Acidobacteriota bacterium]